MDDVNVRKTIKIVYSHYSKKEGKAQSFIIPLNHDEYILYVPRKGICSLVNHAFVDSVNGNNSKVKEIFNYIESQHPITTLTRNNMDNNLTLNMTSRCNMRCTYCYAFGGELNKSDMNFYLAKSTLDEKLNNVNVKSTFNLKFEGGGEPFILFPLIKQIYEYACESSHDKNIFIHPSSFTNGTLSEDQIIWIADVNMFMQLSFDGPPFIQNKQRPLYNGYPSYNQVVDTIKLFNDYNIEYIVRCNVTEYSCKYLTKIIEHFSNLGIKRLNIEPIKERGRSAYTHTRAPRPDVYVKNLIKGFEFAETLGIVLEHQDISLDLKNVYCGADGCNFILNPDGYISSCSEITDGNLPDSDIFLYGRIINSKIHIDQKVLNNLKKRNVHNISGCRDCFAKYNCAGKCFIHSLNHCESIFVRDKPTCLINQELLKYLLSRLLKNGIIMETYDFITKEISI